MFVPKATSERLNSLPQFVRIAHESELHRLRQMKLINSTGERKYY